MKIPPFFAFLLASSLLAHSGLSVDVLGIDFGRNDPAGAGVVTEIGTSAVEPGFRGFTIGQAFGTGVASLVYSGLSTVFTTGSVTVEIQGDVTGAAADMGGRDRGSPLDNGAFTYGDLLRDGIARTKQASTAGDFTFRISGLQPNIPFDIRIWGADSTADVGTTFSWFDTTSGSNLLGSFLNGPANPLVATANEDYSVFGSVTSNAAGQLLFGVTSSNGSPTAGWVNAFQLSAIPEPGAAALVFVVGLASLARRRR